MLTLHRQMSHPKFIDVGQVLKDKIPGIERWLPGFTINWLRRKLHEDELNQAMHMLKDIYGLEFNAKALEFLGANIETVNPQHISANERIIVASNHPLGGLDGMALINAVGKIRPDVRFLVNDVLKNLKNFGDLFVGVNKIGNNSAKSLRSMDEVLRSDDAVLIFPAGLVSRKQQGLIRDLEWKKSFITQAIDHNRIIVPTYIEGENSKFFYRFANIRKKIGIKGNIEMLFLPDEMFKQKGQTIKIHFSKPFDAAILHDKKSHREWAAHLKKFIYSEEFRKGIPFEEYMHL